MNKIFQNTGFTYKSAIDEHYHRPDPSAKQQMKTSAKEHTQLINRIFAEDPKDKMDYLKAKLQCIRTTGTVQPAKKPNQKRVKENE